MMVSMPEARLQVRDSRGQRVIPLDKPIFTIGRRSSCDLPLTDSEISREHAEITRVDDGYVLRDRGSRYGTFVNGAPLTQDHPLAHGDRIRLGRGGGAEVRFLLADDPVAGTEGSAIGGLRQVAALLEALQALGSARVLDEVLTLVLDTAIDVTGAERGFIMLANREGDLELKLARARGKLSLPGEGFATSRKIPEDVFASGEERIVVDLGDGDLASMHEGTLALGIRHVLCVPLRVVRYVDRPDHSAASRAIGVLYLDSREKGTLMSRAARAALATLAVEAAAAIENARLYREAMEKARIDEELRIASQIQQALFPAPLRSGPFFDAAGASIPCRAIGGDFFDYIDLPDGRFAFALGDVAGKGTPAALLTAVLQGIFSGQAAGMQQPADTMALVNRALLARAVEARFATAFLGVLRADGQLAYCNAGHNPPFVFGGGVVRRLTAGGMVLGLFPNAAYEQDVVQLAPGDTVLLFSDGLSEALNDAGDEFGDDRIDEAVRPALGEPPQAILEAALAAVKRFAGETPQHDDVTVLALRYHPRLEASKTLLASGISGL
jgi:sigma-B regulation protein RsbU (phosphoserine phosphatase)